MCTDITNNFLIYGDFVKAESFGNGHINDTFLVTFNQAGLFVRYIIRRINKYVFKRPRIVIRNTINVIEHISKKLIEANETDISRKKITLIKSKTGDFYYKDKTGDYWCAVLFFENAYTIDYVETTRQAYMAAKEFGRFQKYLIDDDVKRYKPSITDFHNPLKRIKVLEDTIKKNSHGRVKYAKREIDQALSNKQLADKLNQLQCSEQFPLRITHNDTKINNVMFEKKTGSGLCVIDLDTVMPGTVIFDFGDMVRTFTSPVAEDEKDTSKVVMQINFFEAIVKGYLEELGSLLTRLELNNLVYGAKLIIYEQTIRFLTDYLTSDLYYNIDYSNHNLIRTRNQLVLLESVQSKEKQMDEIVNNYCKKINN